MRERRAVTRMNSTLISQDNSCYDYAQMRRALYQIVPWTIILLPFLVPGISYSSLPAEITMFRGLDAAPAIYAPKSLFTVFRVPLIEVFCALAIEIMRRRAAGVESQKSYYPMWTLLLYTVAFKTLLQAFEMVSSKDKSDISIRRSAW